MHVEITYEQDFNDLWMYLKTKYSKEIFDLEGIGKQLDLSKFSRDFFSTKTTIADASIDSNANVDDISVITYGTEIKKPYEKLNSFYMTWREIKRLYGLQVANDIIEKEISGDIYINDFHGIGAGMSYCYNYSMYDIMLQGLSTVKKIKSKPPKYLYAFKSQVEQFVTIASNSTLGATGLSDILVIMSFYVENILKNKSDAHFKLGSEEDCWHYIKENLVSLVYTINQPMRGNQSPFTNISVYDKYFLEKLCTDYVDPETGEHPKIEIVQKLQELFLDIMNDELKRTPITFPVTTACFSIDEEYNIKDEEFLSMIAEKNMEYGFINIYSGKTSTLSSCCRLRSDTDNEYFNSFGSGSSKIGSLGVCTINLPRLGFKYKDNEEEMFNELENLVSICAKINNAKRRIVKRRIDNGNQPLYDEGFINLEKQYSTVGINGFNEIIEIMGYNILNEDGTNFGLKIIDFINKENQKYEKQYNAPHNVEQIPAENVSIKLAQKDRLLKFQTDEYEIYSNQFIPLINNADMLDRIKLQGIFDSHFSGGSILHLNVENKMTNIDDLKNLIRVTTKQKVIYFAINYNLQMCSKGHFSVGSGSLCSICGSEITDNYTRVVGFLTSVKNWHKTRREIDYPNRKWYEDIKK